MKSVGAYLFLAFLLVVTGCQSPIQTPAPANKGGITGHALYRGASSSGTNAGIIITADSLDAAGKTVAVTGSIAGRSLGSRSVAAQATTDASGAYSLADLLPGTYTVYAGSPNTLEQAVFTGVTVTAGRSVVASDLSLTPTGSIAGKVTLEKVVTGNLGIVVYLAGTSYSALTKDDGTFTLSGVPAGSGYVLVATYDGYDNSSPMEVKVSGAATTTLEPVNLTKHVVSATTGTLSGTVTLSGQASAANAGTFVYLSGTPLLVMTDSLGAFSLTGVTPGSYTLVANRLGYTSQSESITIAAGTLTSAPTLVLVPATYSITYNANGATGGAVPIDSLTYGPGQTAGIRGNSGHLVKTGLYFAGWNTLPDGSGAFFSENRNRSLSVNQNITLYALWTDLLTVTYDLNGGSGTLPVDNNMYIPTGLFYIPYPSADLKKTGYVLTGWNSRPDGSGLNGVYGSGSYFEGKSWTLYAQWAPLVTITYDANGATGGTVPIDPTSHSPSSLFIVLGNSGNLVKAGFLFGGWSPLANGAGTTYFLPGNSGYFTTDTTLYAIWGPPMTLTYDANGANGGEVPVDGHSYAPHESATVKANVGNLVKTEWVFGGWNTKADGSGQTYDVGNSSGNNFVPTSNTTFYALWYQPYRVTYDANGATGGATPVDSTVYRQNGNGSILGNSGSLVKSGFIFSGWNTSADGSGTSYSSGYSISIVSNVILYAQWAAPLFVTYDAHGASGGTVPIDSTGYIKNSTVYVSANTGNLVKTGCIFTGWNTSADGTGTRYLVDDRFSVVSNVVLYAQWSTPLTVTYDANGAISGTVPVDTNRYAIMTTSYSHSASTTVLGNPGNLTKPGYVFMGWSTSSSSVGLSAYTEGSWVAFSANLTLYAVWAQVAVITYDANGASSGAVPVVSGQVSVGQYYNLQGNSGNLARPGYTFGGWSTSLNGSSVYSLYLTANTTFYAVWTAPAVNYSLSYNANGATGGTVPINSYSFPANAQATVAGNTGNLVKAGASFAGWGLSPTGGNTYFAGSGIVMTENVTLYAIWE